MTPHRWGDLAAMRIPTDPRKWDVMPRDRSPGSWITALRLPSQGETPQWPLDEGSPLTVARQRRIRTGFPSSVSYSVVRTIMRGLFITFGDACLVERGHLVERADGGLEQRQCE